MSSTIQLKTGTGSAVPSSLTQGEVAINIDNGLVYYGSGSTNTTKQLESFTHITASGDISASGTLQGLTGSFEALTGDITQATGLFVEGTITASGDISSSGDLTADNITGVTSIDSTLYKIDGQNAIDYTSDTHLFGSTAKFSKLRSTKGIEMTAPVTASGNISASGEVITNTLRLTPGVNDYIISTGTSVNIKSADSSINLIGNVTASGNISASGNIIGNEIQTHTIDTAPGAGSIAINSGVYQNGFLTVQDGQTFRANGNVELGSAITDTIEIDGHITASGNISASGNVYSYNEQYWSTTARLTVDDNTTNYFGPNPQGTNYYFWNRDLGTNSTTITSKTTTMNSGFKLPYKAILTGYHLNIQGRNTTDNISFTLVYSDGLFGGDVTSTSQTLVEAEGAQTVTITTQNNFYELDRRDQFSIPVSAMTMLYPRFKKTVATGGVGYDFQLAVQYRIIK